MLFSDGEKKQHEHCNVQNASEMWASCFLACTFCTLIAVILLRMGTSWNALIMSQSQAYYRVMRQSLCALVYFCPVMCPDQRKQPNYYLWSMIWWSNLQRVGGTWESDHRVQKSILRTLCNKSWQSLCFNVTRKLISFLYTHLTSYQSSKAPQWPGLEPERGRKKVSIVSVINEIIFIPWTILTDVYSASKSIWASPYRSHIQTTSS